MRRISLILMASMIHLCWMTSYSWAEMVGTQAVISQEIPHKITRETLIEALSREEMQKQLERHGITREEAAVRINSLTDEEISAYWAEMVKTHKIIIQDTPPRITRAMLIDALNREDLQKQLEQYGISKVEAAVRINSLTDPEVAAIAAIAAEVGPLPSGGDHPEDDNDLLFFINILLIMVFIAFILAAYLVGVIFKGVYCIFADCEAKGGADFIFRPWWLNADGAFIGTDKVAPDETNDPPTEQNDSGNRLEGRH